MMMGPDMTGLYILIGIGLLVSGLIAMAKIGMWFWILTNFFSPPGRRPEPPPRPSASGLKTWLSIIATVLGILSTSVGLYKECGPDEPKQQQRNDYEEPRYIMPERGNICCSGMGQCPLMMALQVGTVCTCFDIMGNVSQGEVCR